MDCQRQPELYENISAAVADEVSVISHDKDEHGNTPEPRITF